LPDASNRSVSPQHTTDRRDHAPDLFGWFSGLVTDRVADRLILVLVVYAAIRSVFLATIKPFWYDEMCTVLVARLPSVSTIWRGLKQAVDGMPPPYYLVERIAGRLLQNEQVAFRIPATAGFCCVLVCVFLFVRKRSGSVSALICSLVPLVTILYTTYAAEARPYSLVVAFIAIALLCYQHAPSKPWMFSMGFSLVLALSLHYYAIFALVPFFLAEALLALLTRRLRLSVWIALIFSSAPFWTFWPLLMSLKEKYGAHPWATTTLARIPQTYGAVFNTSATPGFGSVPISGALAVGALAALAIALMLLIVPLLRRARGDLAASTQFSEHVLALGLLGFPIFVFAVSRVTHGGMTPRYSIPTILGIPLAMGFVLPWLDRKTVALVAVFLCLAFVDQEAAFWTSSRGLSLSGEASAIDVRNLIESVGYAELPVVASDALDYLQTQHYSSPEMKLRLFVLVDPPRAVVYAGNDSIDAQLIALQAFVPLHVYDFKGFVSNHPKFLLYSTGADEFDWWPTRLNRDGYSLQVLNAEGSHRVYLVSAKTGQQLEP
jgi:hypothetical protein